MQLRLHASKTIARPQFRELAPQQYSDPETDRTFFGNQFLSDSELINAEARYEYYFGRDQRFSLAGFYKKIDRPIETVAFQQGGTFFTTFANAPEATLYGAELEVQKYLPLADFIGGDFFAARRIVAIGNYTYSDSKIRVREGDETIPVGTRPAGSGDQRLRRRPAAHRPVQAPRQPADRPRNTDRAVAADAAAHLCSKRVTNRGQGEQPDIFEKPGLRLDFVAREGISLFGCEGELKFEAPQPHRRGLRGIPDAERHPGRL
jgi:outer membrane receptor protein involved in Fe transport